MTALPNPPILAAMLDDAEFFNQRIGTTLRGKWKIERLLGFGGMAAVYVAVHTIGHRAAIKILHPEVAASRELRARFEQEAHAVNRFAHPGAVSITDYDVAEDGCPFLVMELLEGDSLQSLLEQCGTLEPAHVLRLADELLDVLAAAHGHGIIHRDVKPDNLFVLRDGRLKVLDFGIARMKEGAPREVKTRTGMAMGTITYMPPEQVRGEHVDGRADLFAVGATMFRLLTGRRIHEADNHADMLVKMASTPAPGLLSVAPALPPDLCKIVDCALAFRKEERYPDALTMQADVRAVRAGQPPAFASARAASPASGASNAASAVAAPALALEPTVAERAAARGLEPTVPDAPAPPSQPASHPATWRSGQPPAAAEAQQQQQHAAGEAAPLSAPARSAALPIAPQKRSSAVIVIAIAAVVGLVLLAIVAVVLLVALRPSATPASSSATESDTTAPAETSTGNATSTAKTPGKTPPGSTTKAPPLVTATNTGPGPMTTTPTATATATSNTPPPGNTGKTPPGQDKKDKDKKNH